MVTSVTPVPEQQHMPRAQARAGGQDAHVRFDFAAYLDSSTPTTPLAKQTPEQSYVVARNRAGEYCCNQQYSVTAITTSTGTIAERYAYSAYGQPTILDASGSVLSASAISNRDMYTGREWDATLGLYHFRARWMNPSAGRFLSRDPIGFGGRRANLYMLAYDLTTLDPSGRCPEYWTACTSNPINADDVIGMPWRNVPLGPGTYGRTLPSIEVKCPCVQCCGKWYFEYINVHLEIEIQLDVTNHENDGEPLDGTYGHEQRHVLNLLAGFRGACRDTVESISPGPFNSQEDCQSTCKIARLLAEEVFDPIAVNESHPLGADGKPMDDHDPLDGEDYPPLPDPKAKDPTKPVLPPKPKR